MAEFGFGNPGSSSALASGTGSYAGTVVDSVVYDQGFGDETALFDNFTHIQNTFSSFQTDSAYQFTGFGDPTPVFVELPVLADGINEFPDQGGVLITLEGSFDIAESYYFQLVGQNGQKYPSATVFASAAKASKGSEVRAYQGSERVRFAMPPVPPGVYDIAIFYGTDKALEITLSQYVKVIRRGRCSQTYSVRVKYPELYSVGARNFIADRAEMGGVS